jgi:1-aminocyclopropane-1-carboxylate deaminase
MQHLFHDARTMPVQNAVYTAENIRMDVLRLDEMHPVISGNKWFKLKTYVADAVAQQKKAILTFGGAYSNHIVATAAAAAANGMTSVGVIRGEQPDVLSPTLLQAQQYSMQLFFISREAYKKKVIPTAVYGFLKKSDLYFVPEGGYGEKGAQGSMDILKRSATETYTHIVAAVGTGTMLAGLVNAAQPVQQVIGISVLKNNFSIENEVQRLLHPQKTNYVILHDFHFGGYAKHTPALMQFMNDWFRETGIPTDFVYTAKTFYAADQLIRSRYFPAGNSLLLIHSGGLQGNRSLPAGTLRY